ncbi:nucleoid-associated protein [Ruminococcaceae bacterium OttesenSCG-928-L11]|nr:nucleoid-associated protein [Ruminococcaceae bacterium OttesenSCG-928-L11]
MALLINKAILHIINNIGQETCYSRQELDVDSETCYEFVSKHVRRLMSNPGAKEATFSAESEIYRLVKDFQKSALTFKDFSCRVCEKLASIMMENREIPPSDILVAFFDNGNKSYIAILKLNYSECFTHRVVEGDGGAETQIIKNTSVLPISASKVDEACLIPYDPMVLRIMEKAYSINGEDTCYFSKLFLECETEMSKKETAEIIQEIANEINAKYFDEDIEVATKVKRAIMEEAAVQQAVDAEAETFVLENAVKRAYEEKPEAVAEFIDMAKDYGLPYEVKLDEPYVKRAFKTQTFKADNGIEIKYPVELSNDPDTIQITTNSDGSVSITLKNLRRGGAN